MTPEEKKQLNELIEFKKNLESSFSIPLSIEQSFKGRFKFIKQKSTDVSATQDINLTGNAQTISVPAQPSGVLVVEGSDGILYQLLYK